jgi:predicted transcriptional regulator
MELFFTTIAFFIITLAASYIFYNRIKLAQIEYDRSRQIIRDIADSFSLQVSRLEKAIDVIEREAVESQYIARQALSSSEEYSELTLRGFEEIKKISDRLNETEKTIKEIRKEMIKLAESPRITDIPTEIEAAIPIQEEDILDQLTETELEMLVLIEEMGEGTVPEIKDKIDKSREHTARTLKKLYDKGFVDRNTSSMPYRYHIRKEIKDLVLKKKEVVEVGF